MSRSRRGPTRGFTLLEAMVSLLLLIIVLIVAMTMLFQMRAFAERQQYFMLPRQAARRATDYLSYYVAGASDLNYVIPDRQSPNALIMYYNLGGALTQASYNNLTGTETGNFSRTVPANPPTIPTAIASTNFGDLGTDILTMVAPFSPGRYPVTPTFPALGAGKDLLLLFRVGCATDNAANLAAFKAATGFDGTQSALLMLVDKSGSWTYVRIPGGGYGPSDCAHATNNIKVTVDMGSGTSGTLPAPPNGVASLTDPVYLLSGIQVISFRVLTDAVDGIPKLQQKLGLFDPNTDNPGTDFTNVLENVEDLQVAYMYPDGNVWNTADPLFRFSAATGGVPPQAGPKGPTPANDVSSVIGLRFSVTGRSPLLPLAAQKLTNIDVKDPLATTSSRHFRPASEDHVTPDPPLYDQFDHYRATATLMLRNRIPRG